MPTTEPVVCYRNVDCEGRQARCVKMVRCLEMWCRGCVRWECAEEGRVDNNQNKSEEIVSSDMINARNARSDRNVCQNHNLEGLVVLLFSCEVDQNNEHDQQTETRRRIKDRIKENSNYSTGKTLSENKAGDEIINNNTEHKHVVKKSNMSDEHNTQELFLRMMMMNQKFRMCLKKEESVSSEEGTPDILNKLDMNTGVFRLKAHEGKQDKNSKRYKNNICTRQHWETIFRINRKTPLKIIPTNKLKRRGRKKLAYNNDDHSGIINRDIIEDDHSDKSNITEDKESHNDDSTPYSVNE